MRGEIIQMDSTGLIYQECLRVLQSGHDVVLATIFEARGSAPRTAGAKMVVRSDGTTLGTIGGGRLENDVIDVARRLFVSRRSAIHSFDLTGKDLAAMDMICAVIASDHGTDFAQSVSDWFIHPRLRHAGEPQRLDPAGRYNLHHPVLEAVVRLMTSHLADPLSAGQLAALAGCSPRQLQRLFQDHLNSTTMRFYRDLRLDKASELLEQSALPVIDIAVSTGFSGVAHFTRCFAERFGVPPARWRRGRD